VIFDIEIYIFQQSFIIYKRNQFIKSNNRIILFINNHNLFHNPESINKSQIPVPIDGGCPRIILLLGVFILSV
jgi:hypothetical protein